MPSKQLELDAKRLHGAIPEVIRYLNTVCEMTSKGAAAAAETTAAALLDRANCWVESLSLLQGARHYQAQMATCRALLEITVDLVLLYKEPASNAKITAWEDSERLKLAESMIEYGKQNTLPKALLKEAGDFVSRDKARIRQQRDQYWRSKHPGRWSGNTFAADVKRAHAAVPAIQLQHWYEHFWRMMCWNVHGSGAVIGRRPAALDVIANTSAITLMLCPELCFASAELALRIATGFRPDEQVALKHAKNRWLVATAGINPDDFEK